MFSRLILLLVHLAGNVVLLWLAYRWLGMDESNSSHLVASFALAAGIVVGFAWLHGFALAKFSGLRLPEAALRSLLKLARLTLLCLLAIAVYAVLAWIEARYSRPAFVIASFLTLHLRTAIPPRAIQNVFHAVVLAFEWGIVPAALLLVAAKITAARSSGSRAHPVSRRSFFLFAMLVAALLLCAIWVPLKLFFWIPGVISFNGQLASMVVRLGLGYLLLVFSILLLEFITAAGRPADTQPSTAV